jgi:hypothetical protein
MKFNLNNRGFSFSPYLMVFMMFLGIVMAFHFIAVDSEKAVAISNEGNTMKNALQMEGVKSAVRNVILLSAYDAIDAAINERGLDGPKKTVQYLGLKDYIRSKIKEDLNNVWSEDHTGLGAYDTVTINELDDNGRVRTDGFLVSAEEWENKGDTPINVEKFVDSGIFSFYDKIKNYESTFYGSLASTMECKLGGITCEVKKSQDWLNPGLDRYVYSISCSKYRAYKGSGNYEDIDESSIPDEQFKSAGEIVSRIKDALKELTTKQINGYGAFSDFRSKNIVAFYSVDYIEANVEMDAWPVDGQCCHFRCTNEKNYCVDDKHEEDYRVNVNIKGKIHFKELKLIGDATLKETTDGTEVCINAPFMNKNGEIKFLEKSKTDFDLPYGISLTYIEGCPPKDVSDEEAKETLDVNSMQYHINEESLKFTSTPVECIWGPKDPDYKPVCVGMKKNIDLCFCEGGCRISENCPSTDPETKAFCPGHPEKEWCSGCD